MRDSLINKVKSSVTCLTLGCNQEWSMTEIIKKADMTTDESLFFEYKISLNAIFSHNNDTSECPNCGQFCQRQQNTQAVRCSICSSKRNDKQADFCWDCKAPWVPNHTCKNRDLEAIQKILNEAPLKTLDYSKIERVPSKRLCPNCRTLIEHERMCKQMKCPSCQTEFCFACLTLCNGSRLQCSGYNKECSVGPVQNAFSWLLHSCIKRIFHMYDDCFAHQTGLLYVYTLMIIFWNDRLLFNRETHDLYSLKVWINELFFIEGNSK